MLRTTFLFTLILMLLISPGAGLGQAGSGPAISDKSSLFAPGQVLVRLKSDVPARTVTSVAIAHGVTLVRRIADHTYVLGVPDGEEERAVASLAANPTVQFVSLNYRITETAIGPLQPVTEEAASPIGAMSALIGDHAPVEGISYSTEDRRVIAGPQEPESCITGLWMSTTQRGEQLSENMVPSGTAQVYIFFEYTACELEAIRVQVFYLGRDTAPEEVFDQEGLIISGSGIQGLKAQAWPHFEKGTFPVGKYLTIISLFPQGGWDQVKSTAWRVSTFPNDYWFQGVSNYQWSLHSTGRRALLEADINMPQAWDITTGSPELIIAVVSTGIVLDHPDLRNKIWTNRNEIPGNGIDDDENGCVDDIHGCEFFDGEATPDPTDTIGWGTFSGGIAAAQTNDKVGMAGVSWGAQLMPIKVLRLLPGNRLGGYLADMITAIDYAVTNGARIIHLGPRIEDGNVTEEQLALLRSVIDDAVSRGALVTAGTGDANENRLSFPAGFSSVVAVGCTDVRSRRCWFSNYGSDIDVVAPGELILSACGSEQYCLGSGTSLAAAHVDGVVSLIWSINPELSPAKVRDILRESATDLGPAGPDAEYGFGKLDAARAVELTPHRLWLRTADLEGLALVLMVDDQINRTCQSVWNLGTAPRTWALQPSTDRLMIESPDDPPLAPVPSDISVCIETGRFSQAGSFEATLEARSTLPRHEDSVSIPVTAIYQPRLPRVRLSLIRRP